MVCFLTVCSLTAKTHTHTPGTQRGFLSTLLPRCSVLSSGWWGYLTHNLFYSSTFDQKMISHYLNSPKTLSAHCSPGYSYVQTESPCFIDRQVHVFDCKKGLLVKLHNVVLECNLHLLPFATYWQLDCPLGACDIHNICVCIWCVCVCKMFDKCPC